MLFKFCKIMSPPMASFVLRRLVNIPEGSLSISISSVSFSLSFDWMVSRVTPMMDGRRLIRHNHTKDKGR